MLVLVTMAPNYVQCIDITILTRVKVTTTRDLNIVINIVIIVNIIRTNTIQMIALIAYK